MTYSAWTSLFFPIQQGHNHKYNGPWYYHPQARKQFQHLWDNSQAFLFFDNIWNDWSRTDSIRGLFPKLALKYNCLRVAFDGLVEATQFELVITSLFPVLTWIVAWVGVVGLFGMKARLPLVESAFGIPENRLEALIFFLPFLSHYSENNKHSIIG